MPNFGPPQIFPAVPINIPGSSIPATFVTGPIAFAPPQQVEPLASARSVPLAPPFYSPPITFQSP